ncbi:SNARE associated Golgi protein-like protein [Glaciecola sp. 4H-3-7+YE-5]|nr:SNARE associated Golgi protein-like protein [Glaciecola sp. 4H-3-7+YE-5]
MTNNASALFKENENCWKTSQATHATPLIDGENYYRALHSAICKAKHSIFIVGWDIDSRIRLLRGEEEKNASAPSVISELLKWKAEQHQDIKIYLLRWDSSLAFFSQREMWAKEVWDNKTPDNVETALDSTIPMGGSQHQKIVVIDDEIAFSGGMDVSTNRWDTREHLVEQPERVGPDGPHGPLHDVQILTSGPIVMSFAHLVRWRWNRISEKKAIDYSPIQDQSNALPASWPDDFPPTMNNLPCAVARTIPFMDGVEPVQEVRRMLLDLIAQAQHFIFIENQFTTRQEIAEALNKRLKACPDLQVIVVSSYEPKGKFESEAYWASRIDFKRILENGIESERVKITYSTVTNEQGKSTQKRVHSKVMSIDDRYLVIGSSNISNRSMSLDTEVDLVFAGDCEQNKKDITRVRHDLLAEHTGRSIEQVEEIFANDDPLNRLLSDQAEYGYQLAEVSDEQFTNKAWQPVFSSLSDPEKPLIAPIQMSSGKVVGVGNPKQKTIVFMLVALLVLVLGGLVYWASHSIPWLTAENLEQFLEDTKGTMWVIPTICIIYVIAGLVFFPVTVLSLAVAAVYGPIWGPIYGMLGALISSATLFGLGHIMGERGLRKMGGAKIQAVDDKFKDSGIVGVAVIRLIPIAPFSLVNLVAGISSIGLIQFLAGTFLGMFPPMIAKGLVGDSLSKIFTNPSPETIGYLALGIGFWALMIFVCQKLARMYQLKKAQAS